MIEYDLNLDDDELKINCELPREKCGLHNDKTQRRCIMGRHVANALILFILGLIFGGIGVHGNWYEFLVILSIGCFLGAGQELCEIMSRV